MTPAALAIMLALSTCPAPGDEYAADALEPERLTACELLSAAPTVEKIAP